MDKFESLSRSPWDCKYHVIFIPKRRRRTLYGEYGGEVAWGKEGGIPRTTSFRWRHRLLRHPAEENDCELSTIVEADETCFLESFKGQRHLSRPVRHRGGHAQKRGLSAEQISVIVAQDRQGRHYDAVLPRADKYTLGCLLLQLLASDSILCTDGAAAYRAVAKAEAIPHEPLNSAAGTRVK